MVEKTEKVEKKYMQAAKFLVPIKIDETQSKMDKEVDQFFNYILLLLKERLKIKFDTMGFKIMEFSTNESSEDTVILFCYPAKYVSSIGRKDFYEVIKKVTDIYNSIEETNGYSLNIRNDTAKRNINLFVSLFRRKDYGLKNF